MVHVDLHFWERQDVCAVLGSVLDHLFESTHSGEPTRTDFSLTYGEGNEIVLYVLSIIMHPSLAEPLGHHCGLAR
jgi:hypothetical protein